MVILPPAALRRLGAGEGPALDTSIVESIDTVPLEEFNSTVPPVPEKPSDVMPVVAVIDDALVIKMPFVALTMNVPPLPPEAGTPPTGAPSSAPLKLADAMPSLGSNTMMFALMVSLPPAPGLVVKLNWLP